MVISKELKDTTYIGIVEDNNDPKKIGRVKARVSFEGPVGVTHLRFI
jgi:hypothetical protein